MLTLGSLNFDGSVWDNPVFKKFKHYIESLENYKPDSQEHLHRGTEMDDLSVFENLEEDTIEWFMDCNLLVDKELISVSYSGLCQDDKCYYDGDQLIDEETGQYVSYWIDITIKCDNVLAMVDLSKYPELLYFLKNNDKYSSLVSQQVFKDAIAKDKTGLISREFSADFTSVFRQHVKK